jgi:hypothetical protein
MSSKTNVRENRPRWPYLFNVVYFMISILTLAFHFLPWRFVVPGYRFPYHGLPSIIASGIALGLSCFFFFSRKEQRSLALGTWAGITALHLVQVILITSFLLGPNKVMATVKSPGTPTGSASTMEIEVPPLLGCYAALVSSIASWLLATIVLLLYFRARSGPNGSLSNVPDRSVSVLQQEGLLWWLYGHTSTHLWGVGFASHALLMIGLVGAFYGLIQEDSLSQKSLLFSICILISSCSTLLFSILMLLFFLCDQIKRIPSERQD